MSSEVKIFNGVFTEMAKAANWTAKMEQGRTRPVDAIEVLDKTRQVVLCHVIHGDHYGQKGFIITRGGIEQFVPNEDELISELNNLESENQKELQHQLTLKNLFSQNHQFRSKFNEQKQWNIATSNDGIHLIDMKNPEKQQGPFTSADDLLAAFDLKQTQKV